MSRIFHICQKKSIAMTELIDATKTDVPGRLVSTRTEPAEELLSFLLFLPFLANCIKSFLVLMSV